MADILVVEDDQAVAAAFERFLRYEQHTWRVAGDAAQAFQMLEERVPDLVIMDVRMPGMDGLQALEHIRSRHPDLYVVIMTAYGTSETSIGAIRAGAFDYLTKPLDLDQLRGVISKAIAAQQSRAAAAEPELANAVPAAPVLIGDTPAMLDVYKIIGRLATTDAPALVTGERGSGKDLVVATIHQHSDRGDYPLQVVDCAELSDDGSLPTGRGTMHLKRVSAMPAPVQSRLARQLKAQFGQRPDSPRVLASTDADLSDEVRAGRFNRELYEALTVIAVRLPPLRNRREDVPLLVRHFIQRFNFELNRNIKAVDEGVGRTLQAHAWPGNVGELERVIKRACIVANGDVITVDDIGDSLSRDRFHIAHEAESSLARATRAALHERLVESKTGASVFHALVDIVETTLVNEALTITNGNQVKAADILRVNRATLRKKI
jgi:DNA-binding NtrC family response regulator